MPQNGATATLFWSALKMLQFGAENALSKSASKVNSNLPFIGPDSQEVRTPLWPTKAHLNNSPLLTYEKEKRCSARTRQNLIRARTRGKCEWHKGAACDTQAHKRPSIIIISGTWCVPLRWNLESLMPAPIKVSRLRCELLSGIWTNKSLIHKWDRDALAHVMSVISGWLLIHLFRWTERGLLFAYSYSPTWDNGKPLQTPEQVIPHRQTSRLGCFKGECQLKRDRASKFSLLFVFFDSPKEALGGLLTASQLLFSSMMHVPIKSCNRGLDDL